MFVKLFGGLDNGDCLGELQIHIVSTLAKCGPNSIRLCVMAVVMNCHTLVWESKSLAALLLPGIVVIHSQLDQ
jgi:hypothetical protein